MIDLNELKIKLANFKQKCDNWNNVLNDSVKNIRDDHGCKFEYKRSVVFPNIDLNKKIKLIIVADNPGDKEQFMGKYLVGHARSLGDSFFKKYNLGSLDDVLILNKTPIHTPRTKELKFIDYEILNQSQVEMVNLVYLLHQHYKCNLWIMGCSELNGIFKTFKNKLKDVYGRTLPNDVYLVRHFSVNSLSSYFNKNDGVGDFNTILNKLSSDLKSKYWI